MHFKLIMAFVDDRYTEAVMQAARHSGATGITLLASARGEGIEPAKTFLGLSLETRRDVLVLVVEEHLSRGHPVPARRPAETANVASSQLPRPDATLH